MLYLKFNGDQFATVRRLSTNPDFLSLLEVFKDGLERADRQNRTREGVQLYRSQGMSELLAEIVDLPATARKGLEAR